MQVSTAKRRLNGPARTLMASFRRIKAAVWTVDDVARLIEWIFKTFRPVGCPTGCTISCIVYTHFNGFFWTPTCCLVHLGPDLQNILRQCYDCLTKMPKLRSTYDGRLIHKTSCEERKFFLSTIHSQNRMIV